MENFDVDFEVQKKKRIIASAMKQEKADLVLKGGKYVNFFTGEILKADIAITEGIISGIGSYEGIKEIDVRGRIIIPGFIDSHIHLESSLVSPYQFAKAVIPHGTTAVVTDPHEIANVMGTDGIDYMLQASEGLPIDIFFVIPSCVPATSFDENHAKMTSKSIEPYFSHPRVLGLGELMDFVGLTDGKAEIIEKIVLCEKYAKITDGHAPDLSGNSLQAYVASGIYSDHECSTYENAVEKIRLGQWIMIREGTAAKNLEALIPLMTPQYSDRLLFATDDKHPNDVLNLGHIDYIVKNSIKRGVDPLIAIRIATLNAALYFGLKNTGAIAPGYKADLLIVDSLEGLDIETVIKTGKIVYEHMKTIPIPKPSISEALVDHASSTIRIAEPQIKDFQNSSPLGLIGLVKDQIITKNLGKATNIDLPRDILKVAVVERHHATGHVGLGFIKGYGLQKGAIATSIAHDAHNIIVVGTNEKDMVAAVKEIRRIKGGMTIVTSGKAVASLPLNIAGLMSAQSLDQVNDKLEDLKGMAHRLGVSYDIDPFMTLSFISLSVIPEVRLLTKGVFDVMTQKYI